MRKLKSKKNSLFVGAAVGTNSEDFDRANFLIKSGVDLIVIDTAHGHSEKVLRTLSKLKKKNIKYQFVLVILQQERQLKSYIIQELI